MAFKISLNGSNYISEARERAFEEALSERDTGLVPQKQTPPDVTASPPSAKGGNGGNGHHGPAASPSPEALTQVVVRDYGRVLEGLERGLAQSYDHQSEMLRVHEQYLSNQASYASIFAALMKEQGTLFTADNTSNERADVLLQVLQSLNRSVEQFHTHQSETLDVHGQFLQQQATYAQAFIELLQTHYGTALNGNGNGNGNGHNGHSDGYGNGNGNGNGAGHQASVSQHAVSALPIAFGSKVAPMPVTVQHDRVDPVGSSSDQAVAHAPAPVAVAPQLSVSADELSRALLDIVSDKTGYPAEMLELDMDMEADLGIDSIKRVEILGALQDAYPELPEVETDALAELRTLAQVLDYMSDATVADPASGGPIETVRESGSASADASHAAPSPVADAGVAVGAAGGSVDAATLSRDLLDIVSDKTGYPAEMLELDMDMEADLGIDSIKRVEILGALQDQHPDLPDVETEALAELRTLAQILDYMADGISRADVTSVAGTQDSKKA